MSPPYAGEDCLGLQGCDVLLRPAGGQLGEKPVQPVDGLDPLAGQLLAAVGEHPQRLELLVVGQHSQPAGADRDRRDRVRVVGVGLAVVPGVEQPGSGRQLGRHVHDVFAVGQEPLRQRPAGAVAAFDRPDPLRPGLDVLAHRGVPDLVGAEPTRGQHRLPVVDDLDRRRQLVGIDPNEHLRHAATSPRRGPVGIARRALLLRAGQSPLEPRLVTAPGGSANRKRATPIRLVGSREKSTPPDAWTESGRTAVLPTIV